MPFACHVKVPPRVVWNDARGTMATNTSVSIQMCVFKAVAEPNLNQFRSSGRLVSFERDFRSKRLFRERSFGRSNAPLCHSSRRLPFTEKYHHFSARPTEQPFQFHGNNNAFALLLSFFIPLQIGDRNSALPSTLAQKRKKLSRWH